MKSKAKKN